MPSILIKGFGNPGRLDDGLGPALAEHFEKANYNNVDVDIDYQLTVEDAHDIGEYDLVIFADADVRGPEPFYFKKVKPAENITFSSHTIGPESLLALTEELFGTHPKAFIVGIRGYEFNEFEEKLSKNAEKNLLEAIIFLENAIKDNIFTELRAEDVPDLFSVTKIDE